MSFNTASVLIQQNQAQEVRLRTDSFNTASVLIQQAQENFNFRGLVVSIQLLFLFNRHHHQRKDPPLRFQYSFCSYSTRITQEKPKTGTGFQYSFCSYSTLWKDAASCEAPKFQYSFCSYSTCLMF